MTPNEQKAIAANVLKTINGNKESEYEIKAKILGGAPRDWLFGNPAKDIDVFFTFKHPQRTADDILSDPFLLCSIDNKTVEQYFDKNFGIKLESKTPEIIYDSDPEIIEVWGAEIEGSTFDFIWRNDDLTYNHFPCSLSKVEFQGWSLASIPSEDCRLSIIHRVIVLSGVKYKNSPAYIEKIRGKFPDYKVVTKEEAYGIFFEER
jgi:hypothetical protein